MPAPMPEQDRKQMQHAVAQMQQLLQHVRQQESEHEELKKSSARELYLERAKTAELQAQLDEARRLSLRGRLRDSTATPSQISVRTGSPSSQQGPGDMQHSHAMRLTDLYEQQQNELDSFKSEVGDKVQSLKEQLRLSESAAIEAERQQAELESRNAKLVRASGRIEELEAEIAVLRSRADGRGASAQAERLHFESRIEQLESRNASLERSSQRASERAHDLEAENKRLRGASSLNIA